METIIQLDQHFFIWIQQHCHTSFMDVMMPWMRNKYSWFPLYFFIIAILMLKYKWAGARIIFVAIMCVVISDTLSSHVMKPSFQRLRPCEEPSVAAQFIPSIECGHRGFSFTSSHAANHFSLAMAIALFFYRRNKWWLLPAIAWAGAISVAQVYVGVHYPLDIVGGALIGISVAFGAHWIIKHYFSRYFNL